MKAIYYLSITAGHDIGPYSGKISKQYRERYANIPKKMEQGREASARAEMITRKVIIHHQSNIVNAKQKKLNVFFTTTTNNTVSLLSSNKSVNNRFSK